MFFRFFYDFDVLMPKKIKNKSKKYNHFDAFSIEKHF
jgi:hypothetical protein